MNFQLGDLAIITTKSGYKFVAEMIDAQIDHIWYPVLGMGEWKGSIVDPEETVELIGRRTS